MEPVRSYRSFYSTTPLHISDSSAAVVHTRRSASHNDFYFWKMDGFHTPSSIPPPHGFYWLVNSQWSFIFNGHNYTRDWRKDGWVTSWTRSAGERVCTFVCGPAWPGVRPRLPCVDDPAGHHMSRCGEQTGFWIILPELLCMLSKLTPSLCR